MEHKLMKKEAKKIFTKSKLPGGGLSVNQYVGCQFACLYCYAKFISHWRPDDYGKWGTWTEAKMNVPELVKNRKIDKRVYMSSVSDPYPPIEKELKLTRSVLANLDKETKISIQTKSDLVLRDIDLFKKFKNIEIGLTINDFSGEDKRIFEPFSPTNERRIEVLETLKQNGIKTFVFISPIIPGLIDIKSVIEKTKPFADYYIFEFINMRGAGMEFVKTLREKYPQSYQDSINRRKFIEFVNECKKVIHSENIKTWGIETHLE